MEAVKRVTSACLRPFYRRLFKPLCRPLMLRLRDFFTLPSQQALTGEIGTIQLAERSPAQ